MTLSSFSRLAAVAAVIPAMCLGPALAHAQGPRPIASMATTDDTAPPEMTEDQKLDRAKGLYKDAEAAFAAGDFATALVKYEEAYYLVPGKHGFAHKVGTTAWKVGDCVKADEYLKHYVTYEDDREKNAPKLDEANKILGEIAAAGCAKTEPEPTGPTTQATDKDDGPDLTSSTKGREAANADAERDAKGKKKGLLIGGAVMLGLGVAAAGTGGALLAIAKSRADTLAEESAPTGSGFSQTEFGDVQSQHDSLPGLNGGGAAALGIGGALIIGGAVMIAIHVKKHPKSQKAQLQGVGPMLTRGGGGGVAASLRF